MRGKDDVPAASLSLRNEGEIHGIYYVKRRNMERRRERRRYSPLGKDGSGEDMAVLLLTAGDDLRRTGIVFNS